ncbi:MAG: biopolymer transporter ExbD, partial [Deltaproteobacteria bacterium]|nr:biopolymer transporter ExbD [Deltaproteobacteria bacterium]
HVFLGESEVPHARLEEALLANARLQREGELYLKADKDIPYGFVVQVMAIIKKAGVPKLGMITDPVEGSWPPADLVEAAKQPEG